MAPSLMSLLRPATKAPDLCVVEGAEGVWSYHLARPGTLKALCGRTRPMMATGIPLEGWGHRSGHLPERYCAACAKIAQDLGVALGEAACGPSTL